ncbi:MAG: T9SS type A sorting domain-containing protein [Bacteroidia bacterium]|jgi:hypothetical protein|nr:T9SS type A sorting domain-containing protein [Bacteroidia bacterium]
MDTGRLFSSLLALCIGVSVLAQNGLSTVSMPAPFNPQVLRNKNCVSVDPGGRVWVGFRDVGAGVWDGTNWTVYDNSSFFLPDNNVQSFGFDSLNGVWVGTNSGGAARFDGVNWFLFDMANSGLPDNHVSSILCTASEIWMATNAGVAVYNGNTWSVMNMANSGLASDTVTALTIGLNGVVWAATNGGLCSYQGNWQTHVPGLFRTVACDSSGVVWASDAAMVWVQNGSSFIRINQKYSFDYAGFTGTSAITADRSGVWFTQPNDVLMKIDSGNVNVYYPGGLFGTVQWVAATDTGVYLVNSFTTAITSNSFKLLHFNPQPYLSYGLGFTANNLRKLNINEVNANLLTQGDMHWTLAAAGYEVPKGSGKHSVFSSGLWIGGLDDQEELHLAAMTYRQSGVDFYPGSIDTVTLTSTVANASQYDRVWLVTAYEISELQWRFANGQLQSGSYTPPADLREWPASGNGNYSRALAPFVDANGDGLYSVYDGDYPRIKGDQYAWWVFNDVMLPHTEGDEKALGVEVHAEAWAYSCNLLPDSLRDVNYTTFYQFAFINRSDTNYHHTSITYYQDCDMGNWQDDWIGSRPEQNFIYVTNGDNDDSDPNYPNYGLYPPQTATVFLGGPPAVAGDSIDNNNNGITDEPGEENRLTGVMMSGQPAPFFNAAAGTHYSYMNMIWPDSSQLSVGGNFGYGGTTPTRFLFPDPLYDTTGWNENTAGNAPFDRRFYSTCGPFDLASGDTAVFTFAIITHFDSVNAWGTKPYYTGLDTAVMRVENWYRQNETTACLPLFNSITENAVSSQPLLRLQPNPAHEVLFVQHEFGEEPVTVQVVDLAGRTLLHARHTGSVFQLGVSSLPTGMYVVRVSNGAETAAARFVKD